MPTGSARNDAPSIRDDVVGAFAMKEHRAFRRANDQVYAIVGANPAMKIVSDTWFGRYDSQIEFQQVLTHILDLFRGGRYSYWLADIRMMATDFRDSERWLVSYLMPEMIKAGLVREAVVVPDETVQVEGEDVFRTASSALRTIADGRVRAFKDIKLARQWLLEGALPG
ncbi:MAG: hypothetical protein VX640_01630 [Pseudomonadota bacterium]|nr:hypothetical protein [Pseudomonadota bacterium]